MRYINEHRGFGGQQLGFIPVSAQPVYLIPDSKISLSVVARYLREIAGFPKTRITGEFFCDKVECKKQDLHLRLRIYGREEVQMISLDPLGDSTADKYFQEAAIEVLKKVNPYVAAAYLRTRDYEEALRIARQISDRKHGQAQWVHNLLGNLHADQHEIETAIAWYISAIDIDPKMIYAHYNLGMAFLADDNPGEAVKAFSSGVGRGSLNPAERSIGRGDAVFDKASSTSNDSAEFAEYYIGWGDALTANKEHDAAIEKYRKAVMIDPESYLSCTRWAGAIQKLREFRMNEIHEEMPPATSVNELATDPNKEKIRKFEQLSLPDGKHRLDRKYTKACSVTLQRPQRQDAGGNVGKATSSGDMFRRNWGQDVDSNKPAKTVSQKQSPAAQATDDKGTDPNDMMITPKEPPATNTPDHVPAPAPPPVPAG